MDCFTFNEFGKNEIKKHKTSPDSFIQIAMQVTYYKLQKKAPCHYESAALRRYRKARTECIRSTSTESVLFAKAMSKDDGCMDEKQLKEMMLQAINAHKNSASEVIIRISIFIITFRIRFQYFLSLTFRELKLFYVF